MAGDITTCNNSTQYITKYYVLNILIYNFSFTV